MSSAEFAYDVVAYPSKPLPQTHPGSLAAIGTLLGMSPASPENCRVLELGGGDGSNLIPLALVYPNSTFLGCDLAATAVAQGNETIARLGLKNITLRTADLLDMPRDIGLFDYIIAHGLFSWVPPLVREKILAVCREHLTPQGIAYISYNALPGCHIRRILRDMMRYHVRHMAQPAEKIEQAVAFAHLLAAGKANDKDPFSLMLRAELQGMIDKRDRAVIYHDDLADINQPYYFHEFMALAAARELQFLAEADVVESSDQPYPAEVRQILRELGENDPLEREQYLDFLRIRRFRQTLLVRNEIKLDREPRPQRVRSLSISSRAKTESGTVNLQPGARESFSEPAGAALALDAPVAKAALLCLGQAWPLPLPWEALTSRIGELLGRPIAADEMEMLDSILHTGFMIGLLSLHAGSPTFVRGVSDRPVVSPLARLQLAAGDDIVTSLRHTPIRVDNPISRQLISLLDGTRDRRQLFDDLASWLVQNPDPSQPAPNANELREKLAGQLEPGLQSVAAMALLQA